MSFIPHVVRRNGRYSYRRRLPSPFHRFRPITLALGTAAPKQARRLSARMSVAFEGMVEMYSALTELTAEEAYEFFRFGLERELAKAIEQYDRHDGTDAVRNRPNRVAAGSIKLAMSAHDDPELQGAWADDVDVIQPVYDLARDYLEQAQSNARDLLKTSGRVVNSERLQKAIYELLRGRLTAQERTELLLSHDFSGRGDRLIILLNDPLSYGDGSRRSGGDLAANGLARCDIYLERDTRRFSEAIPAIVESLRADRHWGPDTKQRERIMKTFAWITGDKCLCDYRPSDIEHYKSALQRIPTTYRWGDHSESIEDVLTVYSAIPTKDRRSDRTLNRDLSTMQRVAIQLAKSSWKPLAGHGQIMNFGEHVVEIKENPLEPDRVPWTIEHLKVFFSSRVYLGGGGTSKRHHDTKLPTVWQDASYWVPLLAAYTYLSREEVCGLEVADVVADVDTPYLAIRRNFTKTQDGHSAGGLKNLHRDRVVPLHPEILRLGFLRYVEAIAQEGHVPLFPELYSEEHKVKGGTRFWASSFRYQVDAVAAVMPLPSTMSGKDADFHSFRTYGASFAETSKVKQRIVDLLFGHASAGTNLRKYSRARLTLDESEYLKRLYDGLVAVAPNVTEHLKPAEEVNLLAVENRSRTGSAPGRRASLSKADRKAREREAGDA